MEFFSIHDAVERMNMWGKKRKPFFFAIDYEMTRAIVLPFGEVKSDIILYTIAGVTNVPPRRCASQKMSFFRKYPIEFDMYRRAFQHVYHHLQEGNTYLVNLTFPTRVELDVTLRDLFFIGSAQFQLWIDGICTVFSPERFVQIQRGVISTFPMKGTIDAQIPNAESILLNDEKEAAEHATTVDLLRNDLSVVARDVRVERYRYVTRIRTNQKELLQVSSHISGILPTNYCEHLGTILTSLLPAGSICGAPKKKTLEIIRECEQQPRGFYTGVFGYFDGENLDSAVMIRYFEQRDDGVYYRSGGGITVYSDVEKEYNELIDKVYVPLP